MVKKFDIFYGVSIAAILILAVGFIIYMKNRRRGPESFDTEIEQGKKEYDDALEKRIAEVKDEHPRYDAELLLDVNRPWQGDEIDNKGWWADVVNCQKNGALEIYCRAPEKWIWPY